tara:strand:- start:42 stop:407 length:366 start_codon:yes stop_codon:yes gene_type:complete
MKVLTEKLEALTIIIVDGNVESADDSSLISNAISKVDDGFENIILDLSSVVSIVNSELPGLDEIQQNLETDAKSFVLCGLNNTLKSALDEKFDEDFFNIVPTRNEAVDMVYMEEQERSFFN